MNYRIFETSKTPPSTCRVCGKRSPLVSGNLGVCGRCIVDNPDEALPHALKAHKLSRAKFNLPESPPKDKKGILCGNCVNNCKIPPGEKGYCGLVENKEGKLFRYAGTPGRGLLDWYYDPLPTNCVAAWVCPGCTGSGFPKYTNKRGPEYGQVNLAVFYGACSFDCLFCQNWHYRENTSKLEPILSAKNLAEKCTKRVSCICYFGGDPAVQMPHSIKTAELAIEKAKTEWNGLMRICWETNGSMNWAILEKAAQLALNSGGNIKFDLKTWSEPLNIALCGVTNQRTLKNFKKMGKYFEQRPETPLLVASTLLIPGYVEVEEVQKIAAFIADINPEIPYSLLAFYPKYIMNDLPTTSKKLALESAEAAKKAGLKNVKIGNIHLLSD
ncbi:MAG: radical SAM protein [Candidatus Freyarchaeota archaeon]|nr:radical SAM protein [Candidatus Jordarchaeia archaeon]MBS7279256.1 radical SAM protein [Candidatus Jordarchaeia archaeon]